MLKKKLLISISVLSVLMNTLSVGAAADNNNRKQAEETIQENSGDLTDDSITYLEDNNKQNGENNNQDIMRAMPRTIPGRWIESGGRW